MKTLLSLVVLAAPALAVAQVTPVMPRMQPDATYVGTGDLVHPAAGFRDDGPTPAIMAVDVDPASQPGVACIRSFTHYDPFPEYTSGQCLQLPTSPGVSVWTPSIDGDAYMSWTSDAAELGTCVMKGNAACMGTNSVAALGSTGFGELDYGRTIWESNGTIYVVDAPDGAAQPIASGSYPTINQNPCWYAKDQYGLDYETCRLNYFFWDLIAFEDGQGAIVVTDAGAHWNNLQPQGGEKFHHPNAEQMYVAYEVSGPAGKRMEVWNAFTGGVEGVPTNGRCSDYAYPVLGGPDAKLIAYLGKDCNGDGLDPKNPVASWALYVADRSTGDVWFVADMTANDAAYMPGGTRFQALPFSFATTYHPAPYSLAVLAYSVKNGSGLHQLLVSWPPI